jgi:hypothetical protein
VGVVRRALVGVGGVVADSVGVVDDKTRGGTVMPTYDYIVAFIVMCFVVALLNNWRDGKLS